MDIDNDVVKAKGDGREQGLGGGGQKGKMGHICNSATIQKCEHGT